MALTRVTSTVLESNAVSAEKMANGSIVTRLYGIKSIEAKHLAASANAASLTTNVNLLQSNINVVHANVVAAQANIISANTAVFNAAKSNDFTTFTSLTGLINATTNNVNTVSANATSVETRRVANIAGALSTITTADLTASRAVVSDGSGKVAVSDVTSTELGYVDGVTSAIQTQLTAGVSNAAAVVTEAVGIEARRAANIAGAVSTITTGNLTASRALVSDGSGKVAALASVTSTELAFLDATSSIQTQLDTKGSTAGFQANDYITFQRLNANINIVSSNVALGLKQLINVAASATGEGTGSNNFFVATPPGSNPVAINNVIVSLNGITQTKTTDYIYTPASGKVTFTDAAIPSGLTVQIITLNPPA